MFTYKKYIYLLFQYRIQLFTTPQKTENVFKIKYNNNNNGNNNSPHADVIFVILGPQSLVSLMTPASVGSLCCDLPVRCHSDGQAADRQVQQTAGSLSEEEHVDQ